jgi:hypothetical protein
MTTTKKAMVKVNNGSLTFQHRVSNAAALITQGLAEFAELLSSTNAPVEAVVQSYHTLYSDAAKAIEDTRKALREGLLTAMPDAGEEQFVSNGQKYKVTRGNPKAQKPVDKIAIPLLTAKGLLEKGADMEIIYHANADKMAALVKLKKLTQEQYDECFPALSPTLKVEKL